MYACITGYFISPCMPLASISGAGIASHIHMDLPDMEPFPEENPSHPGWAGLGWAGLEGGDLSHMAVAVAVLFLVHHDVCMNPFLRIYYFLHCSLTIFSYESYASTLRARSMVMHNDLEQCQYSPTLLKS